MPRTVPGSVSVSSPAADAIPKSLTWTLSPPSSSRFAGFTSRCTIPRAWAASSAPAVSESQLIARGRMERAGAQPVVHGAALEELHDDERRAVVLPDVEDRDDVPLARELRGGERLPLEASAHVLVARVTLGEHLDGDDAAEHRVGRAVDLAHPSARDA